MPPVAAAAAAATAAVGGAFAAASATSIGALFFTGAGGMTAFGQIAAGTALTMISRALTPKPGQPGGVSGQKIAITVGEGQAQSFILGRYSTAGDLLYHGSYGGDDTPNLFYVQVIELADAPASLERVWINGEWVTLGATADPGGKGFPVNGYRKDGKDYLFVKFYDGTQTVADPFLVATFGDDPDRPWTADMIGRGMPYAIVTMRHRLDLHRGKPECMFELQAWHYDRRKDSSAGGSGAQRWDDRATWAPSTNPVVLIDNVLRGLRDPITGDFVWGGQDITTRDLPASVWFAAMNECDRAITLKSGATEPLYRAGLEVRVDEEPAAVVEELLKSCQGLIAEMAGEWHIRAGAPAPAVYAFTDGDVIVTSPDTFDPFPPLDASYNAVEASYPEPAEGWQPKAAPGRANATWLAQDGGRRNAADLEFPAVPYRHQVQRLMLSALKDARRFRRHTLVLPPEARMLGALDDLAWTSERNGYVNKRFQIDLVEDLPNGCVALALRERDPSDYDWSSDDEIDAPVNPPVRPPKPPQPVSFAVEPAYMEDGLGRPRRPAVRLLWTVRSDTTGIRYRMRLAATHEHVPGNTMANAPAGGESSDVLTLLGEPATVSGETLGYTVFEDETAGEVLIPGLPDTDYELQAMYEPPRINRPWSSWLPVTTPDVRLGEVDLDDPIVDKIDNASINAADAAANANAALAKSIATEELVAGLSADVIADLEALTDALGDLDIETVNNLTGVAGASFRQGGWAADPTVDLWTDGAPDHWSGTGIAGNATRVTNGKYAPLGAIQWTVPAATPVGIWAESTDPAELPGADLAVSYVVVGIDLTLTSGALDGWALRADWRIGGAWVAGKAFGSATPNGLLVSDWQCANVVGRWQNRAAIWERPAGTVDAVRVILSRPAHGLASAMRVDLLNIRTASEAEVKALQANGYADAAISEFSATIIGPGGAIAASMDTVRAEFGAADALITDSVTVLASETEALAGRVTVVEAGYGGDNLVVNPVFLDGIHPLGQAPNAWLAWPATAQVREKGTGNPAIVNAPTRYFAAVGTSAGIVAAQAHKAFPVRAGEHVQVGFDHACSVGSTALDARIRWLAADGTTIAATETATASLTGTSWARLTSPIYVVPTGVAFFDLWVRRAADGTAAEAYFTRVESRVVDEAALATANIAIAAAADAESAVATITTTVEATFGTWDAFVSESASAIATAGKAASAYVIRSVAGGGAAHFAITAWDDETGVGGAILLDAPNVIAPGTLSAGEIVITDHGYNLVPDNQLQSERVWANAAAGFTVITDTSHTTAESQGELRWTHSAGSGVVSADGQRFPVRPGDKLTCRFQVTRVSSGTTFSMSARLRFFTRAGAFISGTAIASVTAPPFALQTRETVLIVPAGAYLAQWRWDIDKDATDADVRMFAPSVIRNAAASTLITPDAAHFNELTAEELWVKSINIQTGAATRLGWQFVETFTSATRNAFVTVASVVLARRETTDVSIILSHTWYGGASGGSIAHTMRILRGATAVKTFGKERDDNRGSTAKVWQDQANVNGTQTYHLQVRIDSGVDDNFKLTDVSFWMLEAATGVPG